MQITIVQAEIEAAIVAYIQQQLTVNEGMEIDVDLRATRGETGYQAIIDIHPKRSGGGGGSGRRNSPQTPTPAPASGKSTDNESSSSNSPAPTRAPRGSRASAKQEPASETPVQEPETPVEPAEDVLIAEPVIEAAAETPETPAEVPAEETPEPKPVAKSTSIFAAKTPPKPAPAAQNDANTEEQAESAAPTKQSIFAGMKRPLNPVS